MPPPHCPPAPRWTEPRNQKWPGLGAEHPTPQLVQSRWTRASGRMIPRILAGRRRQRTPRRPLQSQKDVDTQNPGLAAIPGPALAVRAATGAVRPRRVLGGVLTDGTRPLRPRAALSELEETLLRKLRPDCLGSENGFNFDLKNRQRPNLNRTGIYSKLTAVEDQIAFRGVR